MLNTTQNLVDTPIDNKNRIVIVCKMDQSGTDVAVLFHAQVLH